MKYVLYNKRDIDIFCQGNDTEAMRRVRINICIKTHTYEHKYIKKVYFIRNCMNYSNALNFLVNVIL